MWEEVPFVPVGTEQVAMMECSQTCWPPGADGGVSNERPSGADDRRQLNNRYSGVLRLERPWLEAALSSAVCEYFLFEVF